MGTGMNRTLEHRNRNFISFRMRNALTQTLVVIVVGIVLGVSVLVLPQVPRQWAGLIILGLLAPFVMLIVGNVQRLMLAIIAVEIPIQLDKYFFFQEPMANLGSIGGLNISVTTICLCVLYALWFA